MPPVGLIILDGYGVAPDTEGNAITRAKTPYINFLTTNYPVITLTASGEAVGLPWGEMGNSEVGHLTIGAGKILFQDVVRVNRAVENGSIFDNPVWLQALKHIETTGGRLHLVGCLSSGGVHSHISQALALIDNLKAKSIKFSVHAILDGRDMPFDSGKDFVAELQQHLAGSQGILASMGGRYFGMDRDNHWERIAAMYSAMLGTADQVQDPLTVLKASYQAGVYDEQFKPVTIVNSNRQPIGAVKDGDSVVFFNFRPDRARELTKMFVLDQLPGYEGTHTRLNNLFFVTLTEYEAGLPVSVMFPPEHVTEPLALVLSQAGKKQIHIAETEKYAHVTFFFNGGREDAFPGEDRVLIPSPRVSSYDQVPAMSADKVTEAIIKAIGQNYDFILANYANPDMVAHTGNLAASIEAIEAIDSNLERVVEAFLSVDGTVLITADHGNAEGLINTVTGEIDKEHSTTPVPLYLIKRAWFGKNLEVPDAGTDLALSHPVGFLADIAPTILAYMHLPIPKEMTGTPLIPNS